MDASNVNKSPETSLGVRVIDEEVRGLEAVDGLMPPPATVNKGQAEVLLRAAREDDICATGILILVAVADVGCVKTSRKAGWAEPIDSGVARIGISS